MATKRESALLGKFQQAGGCVSELAKAVEFDLGGEKVIVHIAELPDAQFRKIIGRKEGYDRAELIATAIRDEDGSPVFTRELAGTLKPKVARDLEQLVMKANGFDGEEADAEGNA